MPIGSDPGGTPPPARIGDRDDASLPVRVDAEARQVIAEPIGLVPLQKRSSKVPLAAAEEPSDPTSDAAP